MVKVRLSNWDWKLAYFGVNVKNYCSNISIIFYLVERDELKQENPFRYGYHEHHG